MEIPTISIRRHPRLAFAILLVGVVVAGIGLFFGQFLVVFLGVMPVLLAGLMMLNAMVVLSDEAVELKNIFGLTGARHAHDGLHLLRIQDDVLYIQKGDMQAPLRRIVKSRMHPGDWQVMVDSLEKIRAMRLPKK
jgi:hypothetical protein